MRVRRMCGRREMKEMLVKAFFGEVRYSVASCIVNKRLGPFFLLRSFRFLAAMNLLEQD